MTIFGVLLVLVGGFFLLQSPGQSDAIPAQELDEEVHPLLLQVPLENTERERAEFLAEFRLREGFILRDLYEKWIDVIGANGIIHEVQGMYPTCHDRGHDLGKVVYAKIGNIGEALRTCENACYSGCMHGVMMEAFSVEGTAVPGVDMGVWESGAHAEIEDVKGKMREMCEDALFEEGSEYSPGDCAHGVGHALMFISDYEIDSAMEMCSYFDSEIMDYYCATGAYMEYVTQNPDILDDPNNPLDFSPCDTASYPAACFRYKLTRSAYYHYVAGGTFQDFYAACQEFEGNVRLGCMHGFGNAHAQFLVRGEISLQQVCLHGPDEEQYVCIEGAMERIGRYHSDVAPGLCGALPNSWQKDLCFHAIENQLYSMDKPFELYLR